MSLEHFIVVTTCVSGSLYVFYNSCFFHEVYRIKSLLLKWSNSENYFFRRTAIEIIKKSRSKFLLCRILDPCLKYVMICYSKFYSSI